jgi:hypothetical protein
MLAAVKDFTVYTIFPAAQKVSHSFILSACNFCAAAKLLLASAENPGI